MNNIVTKKQSRMNYPLKCHTFEWYESGFRNTSLRFKLLCMSLEINWYNFLKACFRVNCLKDVINTLCKSHFRLFLLYLFLRAFFSSTRDRIECNSLSKRIVALKRCLFLNRNLIAYVVRIGKNNKICTTKYSWLNLVKCKQWNFNFWSSGRKLPSKWGFDSCIGHSTADLFFSVFRKLSVAVRSMALWPVTIWQ